MTLSSNFFSTPMLLKIKGNMGSVLRGRNCGEAQAVLPSLSSVVPSQSGEWCKVNICPALRRGNQAKLLQLSRGLYEILHIRRPVGDLFTKLYSLLTKTKREPNPSKGPPCIKPYSGLGRRAHHPRPACRAHGLRNVAPRRDRHGPPSPPAGVTSPFRAPGPHLLNPP